MLYPCIGFSSDKYRVSQKLLKMGNTALLISSSNYAKTSYNCDFLFPVFWQFFWNTLYESLFWCKDFPVWWMRAVSHRWEIPFFSSVHGLMSVTVYMNFSLPQVNFERWVTHCTTPSNRPCQDNFSPCEQSAKVARSKSSLAYARF